MARKVVRRLERSDPAAVNAWVRANSTDTAEFCRSIDPDLWEEAIGWFDAFRPVAERIVAAVGVDLGGALRTGGCCTS